MLSSQPPEPPLLARTKRFNLFEQNEDGVYALSRTHGHRSVQGMSSGHMSSPRRRIIMKRDSSPVVGPGPVSFSSRAADSISGQNPLLHATSQDKSSGSFLSAKSQLHMYAPTSKRRTPLSDRISRTPSHHSALTESLVIPPNSSNNSIEIDDLTLTEYSFAGPQPANRPVAEEPKEARLKEPRNDKEVFKTKAPAIATLPWSDTDNKDVSSLLMEFARNHETQQSMLKSQASEMQSLQQTVADLTNENKDLKERYRVVKDKSVALANHSSSCLESLKQDLDNLKAQSDMSFQNLDQLQSAATEVGDLRLAVATNINDLDTCLRRYEVVGDFQDIKEACAQVELEAHNKQQVLDIVRDRLDVTLADLVEARTRIQELEASQSSDRIAIGTTLDEVAKMRVQLSNLSNSLREQQMVSLGVERKNAELEAHLSSLSRELAERRTELEIKNTELAEAQIINTEYNITKEKLEQSERRLQELTPLPSQLDAVSKALQEAEHKVDHFKLLLEEKQQAYHEIDALLSTSTKQGELLAQKISTQEQIIQKQQTASARQDDNLTQALNNIRSLEETLCSTTQSHKSELERATQR
ncbi:hypothetical protein SISSUDRAFT_921737 [Sistotremastrum suecicum HHB10207 ss-3]|uniref:Uncharacterized protein n=1 Tax=Sistotremastrum suecicum HHB10207 ss-3 TaxID=1314776 RepID=A0A166BX39_9AGAM|nr:hypothetical protein SISSUDRAFT_921737 [Sistotremastrum suecicum HHB10207 ss-3]